MKVSVFTPSHSPRYLRDAWKSLSGQTHQNWEWVVGANGENADLVEAVVAQETSGDSRVRVFRCPDTGNIGALKRECCLRCDGDIVLELDHDDILTSDCLASVVEAVEKTGPMAFVYSDDVTCNHEHQCAIFDKAYGWRHYSWQHGGQTYTVNKQPPPHPRSLSEILYAPDHVRAWTAAAYRLSGGHDPKKPVADDHDLVVRTYLAGVPFVHIERPLYFHRQDGKTTSQEKVERIQACSRETRHFKLRPLIAEWCRRENLPMLDLGGAHNCPPGFVPVDPAAKDGYQCDVFHLKTEIADSSVGCFRASDFLEHIPGDRVPALMNLLYAKLVPGGFLISDTPSVSDSEGKIGRGAFQDPTHCSYWSENNSLYYTDRNYAKYVPEIQCRFQTVRSGTWYPSEWHRKNFVPYVYWDAMSLKDDDKTYLAGPRNI